MSLCIFANQVDGLLKGSFASFVEHYLRIYTDWSIYPIGLSATSKQTEMFYCCSIEICLLSSQQVFEVYAKNIQTLETIKIKSVLIFQLKIRKFKQKLASFHSLGFKDFTYQIHELLLSTLLCYTTLMLCKICISDM